MVRANRTPLEIKIENELRQAKWMSMARFMEAALYDPELGYYTRAKDPFGIKGDFYTAEQLQPVFGEVVASYVKSVMLRQEKYHPFQVVELGAGRQEMRPHLEPYGYRGIEIGDAAGATLKFQAPLQGLVFANEFFDALPANVLRKDGADWIQIGVALVEESLRLVEGALADGELLAYAERWGTGIAESGTLNVNLESRRWLERIDRFLVSGEIVVIDYGYEEPQLARMIGDTLLTYRRHLPGTNILAHIGEQDLTTHVNFSDLRERAGQMGWRLRETSLLANWVLGVWDEAELASRWSAAEERWRLQWKQLVFGLGESFRVTIWEKG